MEKTLIDLRGITKSFDGELILDDLNLSIRENSFVTLLGPSGCGKTTTLRIIGGFVQPDKGQVFFEGKDITNLPANKRQLNTVFQKYALFPHMNIEDNIAFGLRIRKKSEEYIREKIQYALKLVNLQGYEKRSVTSLSGGQQQRIAIARAIVNEPRVLLLDEPLGALDLKLRQEMQYELIRLKNELGITFIYVTHDQEEALTMSDYVVVMNQGYIQQAGSPEQIYNEPENAFVADFIGDSNIVPGIMLEDRLVQIFGANFPCIDEGFGRNKPVDVVIRPEDVEILEEGDDRAILKGTMTHIIFKGEIYEMECTTEDGFEWLVHSTEMHEPGKKVGLYVRPSNIQIMNKPESEDEEAIGVEEYREYLTGHTIPHLDVWFYCHSAGTRNLLCLYDEGGCLYAGKCRADFTVGKLQALGFGTASFFSKYGALFCFCLSACFDSSKQKNRKRLLCGVYFYSSHVDEFAASHSCVADFTRAKRGAERDFAFFASTKTEPHQYSLCHYSRHGL